jgi:hypothetical protein
MAAEHCTMGGCDYEFTYPLLITTTTPRQEWFHVVSFNGRQHLHQSDMSNGRRLLSIEECLQKSTAKRAGLNRAEIIALIMFTGPMVTTISRFIFFSSTILHRKRLPRHLPRRVSPVTIFHADSNLQSNITPVSQGAVRIFRKSRQSLFFHYLRILFSHGQAVPRFIVDGGDQSVQRCTHETCSINISNSFWFRYWGRSTAPRFFFRGRRVRHHEFRGAGIHGYNRSARGRLGLFWRQGWKAIASSHSTSSRRG